MVGTINVAMQRSVSIGSSINPGLNSGINTKVPRLEYAPISATTSPAI